MAKYSIAVADAPDKAAAASLIRTVSNIGIADIVSAIGTSKPIAEFDTWDFSLEMGYDEGVAHQQKRISEFLRSLRGVGATVVVTHNAGAISEVVSLEMLNNLFESEIQDLAQNHD